MKTNDITSHFQLSKTGRIAPKIEIDEEFNIGNPWDKLHMPGRPNILRFTLQSHNADINSQILVNEVLLCGMEKKHVYSLVIFFFLSVLATLEFFA